MHLRIAYLFACESAEYRELLCSATEKLCVAANQEGLETVEQHLQSRLVSTSMVCAVVYDGDDMTRRHTCRSHNPTSRSRLLLVQGPDGIFRSVSNTCWKPASSIQPFHCRGARRSVFIFLPISKNRSQHSLNALGCGIVPSSEKISGTFRIIN